MKKKLQKSGEKKSRSVLKIVLVLLLAFTVYGFVTAYSTYNSNLERNYENIDNSVQNTIDVLGQSFAMIKGTTIAISGGETIINWTKDNDYFDVDEKQRILRIKALEGEMQRTLIYNNGWNLNLIDYVAVFEDDTLLSYTFTKPYNVHTIEEKSSMVNKKIQESEDFSIILPPTDDDPTMYTTLKIQSDFSKNSKKKSLYIVVATDASFLENSIKSAYGYDGAIMYLTNKSGMIYASNVDNKIGKKLDDKIMSIPAGGIKKDFNISSKRYAVAKRSINSDFYFIYLLPKSEIVMLTIKSMESLLVLTIALTLIMVFLITMVERQYEEKILMEESEILFLQQQMNPHFLFNILLTIQIKAKMSGDEPVSKMITSLSNLLRAGIYRDKRSTIPVSEELKYVEYYLSLQKARYEERLSYDIKIESEDLKDLEVPRLSIEPLVENAVVHGLEVSDKEGHVEVLLSSKDTDLIIHVKDNGVGFDIESLDLEENGKDTGEKLPREKVGVKNTNRRLKLLYGEKYGLKIDSKLNEGTDIEIRIPKKKWVLGND